MVDVEYLPLEEIGGCFYCEGGLSYPWKAVDKKGVVLVVLKILHEVVEFLLAAHHC